MKHKHTWHFIRIYWKSPLKVFGLDQDKRYATFICSECGLLKEMEVIEDGKK